MFFASESFWLAVGHDMIPDYWEFQRRFSDRSHLGRWEGRCYIKSYRDMFDDILENVVILDAIALLAGCSKHCRSAWPDCRLCFLDGCMMGPATLQAHLASSYQAMQVPRMSGMCMQLHPFYTCDHIYVSCKDKQINKYIYIYMKQMQLPCMDI